MTARKIHFQLTQDEDGYPPVAVESVWAQPTSTPNEYVLDNVPFFARDATLSDVVGVREQDGQLWFARVVRRSGNSLLRIVFFDKTAKGSVEAHLQELGCSTEFLAAHGLLAVNVPPAVPLSSVQRYLSGAASGGTLDYEEPILRQ